MSTGPDSVATRAGYVALVGRPNVGKSTLLNAFTGEKLSIVTARAQTTREQVLGIETTEREQIVFVDTPGLLEPRYLLHRSMLQSALAALADADLVLLLLDPTDVADTFPAGDPLALLRTRGGSLFVAVNKIESAGGDAVETLARRAQRELGVTAFRISAVTGDGVAELRRALGEALPVSPFLYPPDEIAVQPVRFFVAELVRETIFEEYEEEVPYATVVRVEEYRESAEPIYIRATIYVERDSQKPILIGRQGAGIRRLGVAARRKIEAFVGAPVYLDLWVKPLKGWRQKPAALKYLGYAVPPESGGQ